MKGWNDMSGIKIEWTEPGPMCKCRLTVVHGAEGTVEYRDPTEADLTKALGLLPPEVRERVVCRAVEDHRSGSRPAQERTPATRPIPMSQHLREHGLPESWAEWAREIKVLFDMALFRITVSGVHGRVVRCFAQDITGPWQCENRAPWCPEIRLDGWIDPDPSLNSIAHWKFVAEKTEKERDKAIEERNALRSNLDAVRKAVGQ